MLTNGKKFRLYVTVTILFLMIIGILLYTFLSPVTITVSTRWSTSLHGASDPVLLAVFNNSTLNDVQNIYAKTKSDSDINNIVFLGQNLLEWSISEKRDDISIWLLKKGADPNPGLEIAVAENNLILVDALLRHGADPSLKGLIRELRR